MQMSAMGGRNGVHNCPSALNCTWTINEQECIRVHSFASSAEGRKSKGTLYILPQSSPLLTSAPSRSFSFRSSCSKRSVTSSILGTSAFASRAVTNMLYDSGKLASRCTTRSSSGTGSPTTDNASKTSVIALTCL